MLDIVRSVSCICLFGIFLLFFFTFLRVFCFLFLFVWGFCLLFFFLVKFLFLFCCFLIVFVLVFLLFGWGGKVKRSMYYQLLKMICWRETILDVQL